MKLVKPLSDSTIQSLKPQEKEFRKYDGKESGLFIRVMPSKKKTFYFEYKFAKKLKKIKLGDYPTLSLTDARDMAREYRGLVLRHIDPRVYRESLLNPVEEKKITFAEMATRWRDKRLKLGKLKAQTVNEAFRRVELHLFPKIADLPIDEANYETFGPALSPLKNSNTLYKINIAINQIFRMAEDEDLIVKNPFRKIHDEFTYVETKNHPTITPEELPHLFKVLQNSDIKKPTALLIEWQLLSILRSSEAVRIEWADIDWEAKALHIPAERMKGGKRAHSVPLSSQALNVLEQMRRYTGNRKYVFCSRVAPYNRPMNSGAANVALKRMGFKDLLVAHGLRSIASTYLHELDCFSSESIELCLSHENRGKVRKAYDKSKKWKSRQAIMQCWGDYVEQCKLEAMKA
ncbi:tyrosine-type recombinase/integrase [Rodentibacter heidelbergensis]|uniref:Integrase n=1 Tax=Rodentibacter heidelbergensis TaxID=1908258 RepID=A0A1V3IB41_9PAST|nr:tyrosine-type recombinase/integrase [Rodentibacter heidelbergensis]OOF37373.1 integrase [Rodentibacter heidelbergensis]